MITTEFKQVVRKALLEARDRFTGSDAVFARQYGMGAAVFSRVKNGEIERILSDGAWITIGRKLDVQTNTRKWNTARTTVYNELEETLNFCQQFSKSMMLVDDAGIGKSFCAKIIVNQLINAFYVDCSQAKNKQDFVRHLARTVGLESTGVYRDVKANLKYFLTIIDKPLIVLDEFGDLEYNTLLEVKELWNATEGRCAWYAIGAEGLRAKIETGIRNKRVGFRELYRRFAEEFIRIAPAGSDDRTNFYKQLYHDVAQVNCNDKSVVDQLVKKCLSRRNDHSTSDFTSLSFLQTSILISQA